MKQTTTINDQLYIFTLLKITFNYEEIKLESNMIKDVDFETDSSS